MYRFLMKLREEKASAIVESVIILPVVFIVIFSMILTAFIIHDRSTVEAAAQRGAIYAARCISDPGYLTLVGQTGELDVSKEKDFTFSGVDKNINAYRYITGGDKIKTQVTSEVQKVVEKTRIKWLPQDSVSVSYTQKNMFLYQDVTVKVTATYSIPEIFGAFGLDTEYTYSAEAKTSTTDPDEFIRNADLVVDLITDVDKLTGGHLKKVTDTIGSLANKLLEWLE